MTEKTVKELEKTVIIPNEIIIRGRIANGKHGIILHALGYNEIIIKINPLFK